MKKLGVLLFLLGTAIPCFSDFSSRLNVKTNDGTVNTYPYQAKFPNGTLTDNNDGTVSISSSIVDGSTNYVQTNPTAQQTTAFNTSSGTVAVQLNTSQIRWQSKNSMMLYPDGVTVMSMPTNQDTFLGYFTNLVNTGGVFNTGVGVAAMPYPGSGNFNTCIGNSCMSGNVITTAENNNSMGYGSCGALRAGFYNNCMGGSSGNSLRDGNYNTHVGSYAGERGVDTNGNTDIGFESNRYLTAGEFNVSVGFDAGDGTSVANANVSGNYNVYLGHKTGQDVASATIISNSIAIGNSALVHASNKAQIGGQQGTSTEVTLLVSTISVNNHYNNAGSVSPVVSSCGATPSGSVVGYDSAGTITVGGGVVTSCTLTFATAWTNTPTCVISDNSTAVTGDISSISSTAITFGFSTSLGGGKIYYICMGSDS